MNLKRFQVAISNVLNDKRTKISLSAINGISEIISAIHDNKKNNWFVLKTIASNLLKFQESSCVYTYEYFDSNWTSIMTNELRGIMLNIVEKYPYTDLKGSESESWIRIYNVKGHKVGLLKATNNHCDDFPLMALVNEKEHVEKIIRECLWESFGNEHVLLTKKQNSDAIVFKVDESITNLNSDYAKQKSAYFQKCIDVNLSRSLLLYGPPGTGKSTIAKTIIHSLKLKSFRINLQDLNRNICSSTINEAIAIFKPDALIIDDMDRSNRQDELLMTIELLHNKFKIIIVTANDIDKFDAAMLRPERFDEIELIRKLDENVIRELLGSNIDLYDQVKDWPISFISEINNRRKVENENEIIESIKELNERIEQLNCYKVPEYNNNLSSVVVADF